MVPGHWYACSAALAQPGMVTDALQVLQRSCFWCWLGILPLLSAASLCLPSGTPRTEHSSLVFFKSL